MTYPMFMRWVAPLIQHGEHLRRSDYTVICVLREPISWLHSWYRFRSRRAIKKHPSLNRNFTGSMSFSDFVRSYCSAAPGPFAQVGDPMRVLLDKNGAIGPDRVFAYEDLESFAEYLSARLRHPIELPSLNESPPRKLELEPGAEAMIRARFARAIEFHSGLRSDGLIERK
jgi:hypothetical protein